MKRAHGHTGPPARVELATSIGDLLRFFREERRLFGRCPHCGQPFRVSEARITYGQEPPRDLLTRLQRERDQLRTRIEELDAQLEEQAEGFERELGELRLTTELQHEAAVQRRLQAEIKQIRARAVAASRAITLGKTIERIAPWFASFGHAVHDVRALYEPIDYVVFDGLHAGCVTNLTVVEFKTARSRLTPVQASIADCIERGRVRFEERRITTDMLRRLERGRPPPRGQPLIELRAPRGRNEESGDGRGDGHA